MVASLRETVLKSRGLEEKKTVALPIDQISPSPYQPRIYFNQAELIELAESIRQVGLLQPVEVRRSGTTGYELVLASAV
jgi:ParB family transcriptional regulator, chromosome partitioning protein